MENEKPNNTGAFPNDWNIEDGMTLRDYFAAKAMQSVLISKHYDSYTGNNGLPVPEFIAKESYEIADEMLKQRDNV